ncbi:unnamed protein product [Parnassius mnemosyne]|uniref:Uncharacterized protein n=1 Tax=Parnassius mnemosyne TaxID=213953 RepID=A0AAV1LSR4_9NEOP
MLFITICSLTQAAYYSRVANVNRVRSPAVFRPGVVLQRPWTHQRIMPAAAALHRAPYVVYRSSLPHRYAVKHYNQNVRSVFPGGAWKTARLPPAPTTEYEYIRAASPHPVVYSHGDAIHTIPAPNLSLSEKPIVVADSSEGRPIEASSEAPKTTYEVTEKYTEPIVYQAPNPPKIEAPTGFSKQSSLTTPEFQQFVRNGAAFHLPTQYGVTSLSLPQNQIIPQQFSMQGLNELSGHQNLLQTTAEGFVISPHALYQNDPNFLQKLQNQLLQFQSVEFIPYPTDVQPQIQQTSSQPELFLLENEVITKQIPTSFKPREPHRNIVQRETQEGSVLSLIPQAFTPSNVTENFIDATTLNESQNVTLLTVTSETEPPTTTVKNYVETTTEEQKTTPIYYAQVGQNVSNVMAKEFYSAINDVSTAAALAQEKVKTPIHEGNVTTTTAKSETGENKSINAEKEGKNETLNEIKPIAGTPFEKPDGSVNVAYTLLRSQDQTKVNKEGNVFAGQLVQAMISEDRDFTNVKVNTASRRPPLRLITIPENKMEIIPQKLTVVKAKIPPKSKLSFDNKTGEPILRIYASYSENPMQKEVLLSKLSNVKQFKDPVTRKQDNLENRKAANMKTFDQTITNDPKQVSQFGLKLRSRSDDYIPLFEEYEE